MSRLLFFMNPEDLSSVLEKLRSANDIFIIFRCSISDNSEARFKILNPKDNLYSEYKTGDYKQIYISVAGLPLHDRDWQFTDRSADNLIVIDGGRIRGNYLEICEARIFSKTTNTKSIFNKLRRLVVKICFTQGLYTKTGRFYKNIYYDNKILNYEFHFDLVHEDRAYTLVKEREDSGI